MLTNDYTETLFGFKDMRVIKVESFANQKHIHFELERKAHNCPRCQQRTDAVHDYRMQVFKDAPILEGHTFFHYRKRRYVCSHCGKRFYEKNDFLPRYYRMSTRLIQYVVGKMHSTHSVKSIAKLSNLSTPTVFRIFRFIEYPKPPMPRVLSIDEFKGNAGRKFQGILTDPVNKKVLDILPGREGYILTDYFKRFKDRDQVEYFVMDMCITYRELAKTFFKNATIVIDRYHWIRQGNWAFERVRKEEQKRFFATRRKYFKRSRYLLLKRRNRLSQEEMDQVTVMLSASRRLATAYLLKEKFYEFVDAPDYETAVKKLEEWYLYVGTQNEPEFEKCMKTIRNWQPYILNSFSCPHTNGYTEGVNNKIKVLKRNAYGLRNFDRFRNRILLMMS